MKIKRFAIGLAIMMVFGIPLAVLVNAQSKSTGSPKDKPAQALTYKFTGPYVHKNLTVFLIHGKDMIKSKVDPDFAGGNGAKDRHRS